MPHHVAAYEPFDVLGWLILAGIVVVGLICAIGYFGDRKQAK